MVAQDILGYYMNAFREKYPSIKNLQDCHLFTMLCMKYFFFNDTDNAFDPEIAREYLTDGANDGGIDAVFVDPSSENNDVVIIQSKYYEKAVLAAKDVVGELYKIKETISELNKFHVEFFNNKMVTAYKNAIGDKGDNGVIRIYLFTSYAPKDKRERNKLERAMNKAFSEYETEIDFREDIEAQIMLCEDGKLYIDSDKLLIDDKDNYLEYEDSIIVNISARSLQDLQNRRRNGLLGMNLRFYIKQKNVDDGIAKTISKEPENFWYKNNGIIIVCDDYWIDGKELKLTNFSIVNGGQTTNRIGNLNIDKDFYLMCKVVKAKGTTENERDLFVHNIAEATNAQKAIKKADLKSNTPEQLRLKERLRTVNVYYMTKKGEKPPHQFSEPYQFTTLDQVGKLGLATVMQMPGSARSNPQRMFADENYYTIYGSDAREGVIADTLKIEYYYKLYLKNGYQDLGLDERTEIPMVKNGRTYQYACITLLSKLKQKVFLYDTIAGLINNTDELKNVLRQMGDMKRIITHQVQNEKELFFTIFTVIGGEVLGYCFDNALSVAEENQQALAAADYLKRDTSYYKDIIKRLRSRYKQNKEFRECVDTLMG